MLFNLHRRNYISFVTPTKQSKNQIRTKKQTSPDLIPTETPFTAARFSPKAFLKYFVRFSMRSIKPFSFRIRCLSSATSVSSTRFVPSERFSLKKNVFLRSREYRFTHMNHSTVGSPFLSEALSGERI